MTNPDDLAAALASLQGNNGPKTALERKLESYKKPASLTEQDRQDRAERMVRNAVSTWPGFKDIAITFLVKGSYANKTNVKADSDVDIAVIHKGMHYLNDDNLRAQDKIIRSPISGKHYSGIKFRMEMEKAAVNAFGTDACDISGKMAVTVAENSARVSADIVPSFEHRTYYYDSTGAVRFYSGTVTFRKDGTSVYNYPKQQLINGIEKNNQTGRRYKQRVRILKRLENDLVAAGKIRKLPSFFMECLVYNVPNHQLGSSSSTPLTDDLKNVLSHVWMHTTQPAGMAHTWHEPNGIKKLFHQSQPWSQDDARALTHAAWNYLGLA